MAIDEALARRVLDLLNEVHALDPAAVNALVNHRVPCNAALVDHPTVQCGKSADSFTVGLIGLLNGLVGVDAEGNGAIASMVDTETGTVTGFKRFG
jgi:hypothetical protein